MLSKCFAIAVFALLPLALAHASGGRSLPRGEEHPAMIEKIYSSPVGEVQFTVINAIGRSGFLRNSGGNLMGYQEVRGPEVCREWFLSAKADALPRGCEFVFYDAYDGRSLAVRSEEMEEASLFEAMSGKYRGVKKGLHVAL